MLCKVWVDKAMHNCNGWIQYDPSTLVEELLKVGTYKDSRSNPIMISANIKRLLQNGSFNLVFHGCCVASFRAANIFNSFGTFV